MSSASNEFKEQVELFQKYHRLYLKVKNSEGKTSKPSYALISDKDAKYYVKQSLNEADFDVIEKITEYNTTTENSKKFIDTSLSKSLALLKGKHHDNPNIDYYPYLKKQLLNYSVDNFEYYECMTVLKYALKLPIDLVKSIISDNITKGNFYNNFTHAIKELPLLTYKRKFMYLIANTYNIYDLYEKGVLEYYVNNDVVLPNPNADSFDSNHIVPLIRTGLDTAKYDIETIKLNSMLLLEYVIKRVDRIINIDPSNLVTFFKNAILDIEEWVEVIDIIKSSKYYALDSAGTTLSFTSRKMIICLNKNKHISEDMFKDIKFIV